MINNFKVPNFSIFLSLCILVAYYDMSIT